MRNTARRVRLAALAAALVGVAVFFGSGRFSAQVIYDRGAGMPSYRAQIATGVVRLVRNNWQVSTSRGWLWSFQWYGARDLHTPWRPYHSERGGPGWGVGTEHGLVVPLWPWPLGALGVAIYAHGLVRGRRQVRLDRSEPALTA